MRLKKKVRIILAIAIILIVLGVGYVLFFHKRGTGGRQETKLNEIKEYGYVLTSGKSKEYKDLFSKLKTTLEKDPVDEEEYVSLISQMFVLDFFTLNDKIAKTDVGGVEFVIETVREDFLEKAMDSYYKYVENNLNGKRTQELPTVQTMKVEKVGQDRFDYGNATDDSAYYVTISWDYDKGKGYQTDAELIFVHDGKKLVLVELNEVK